MPDRMSVEEIRTWLEEAEGFVGEWGISRQQSACEIIRQLLEERSWQPIETAPKDGTVLLLCGPEPEQPWCAYWCNNASEIDCGEPSWIDGSIDKYEKYYALDGFTHWMSLPAWPKTAAKKGEEL